MTRHLHIDPFSGIAGDMFLGAVIDLGVDAHALSHALGDAGLDQPFHLHHQRVLRQGIGGVDVTVHAGEHQHHHHEHADHEHAHEHGHEQAHGHHHHHHEHAHPHAHDHGHGHGHEHEHDHAHDHDHRHHHVGRREILAIAERLALSGPRVSWARAVVDALAHAEGRVHGMSPDAVHFHEVGALDSIVDMLGSVWALEQLGVTSVTCGPVPVSRGSVRCAHGLMPVPAPATAYLLEGRPVVGVDRVGELVTPTGAALIAGLCRPGDHRPMPAMMLEKVGYGAGDRDFPEAPNLLRLLLGRPAADRTGDAEPSDPVAAIA